MPSERLWTPGAMVAAQWLGGGVMDHPWAAGRGLNGLSVGPPGRSFAHLCKIRPVEPNGGYWPPASAVALMTSRLTRCACVPREHQNHPRNI